MLNGKMILSLNEKAIPDYYEIFYKSDFPVV